MARHPLGADPERWMADHPIILGVLFGGVTFVVGLLVATAPATEGAAEAGAGMFAFGVFVGVLTRRRRRS